MFLCDAEYHIISSAIVGGCLPIAVGMAMGLKRQGKSERVWVFSGDMAAETGAFLEATKYAGWHDLRITFVIEDNGLSTNTPTIIAWGEQRYNVSPSEIAECNFGTEVVHYYYKRTVPHVGAGTWVTFS